MSSATTASGARPDTNTPEQTVFAANPVATRATRQAYHPPQPSAASATTQTPTITAAATRLRGLLPSSSARARSRASAITSAGMSRKASAMPSGIRMTSSR